MFAGAKQLLQLPVVRSFAGRRPSSQAVRAGLLIAELVVVGGLLVGDPAPTAASGSAVVGPPPAAPSGGATPADPAELEAFLDGLMARDMAEHDVVGAAVAVVGNGRLLFAKGYGYADAERGVQVDAATTMFRIGSVGKTFTWTAVMQLVEQGKIDLDADVNTYLDFRIPDTYPQSITMKHLMTHTSGFEDKLLGAAVDNPQDLVPAGDWVRSHLAARVFAPGTAAGYSNFNAILAGYIVARVSGQPYDRYLQEHILDPLGMRHSTVHSPMPADLRPFLSMGYAKGGAEPFPFYEGQPGAAPSGLHMASVTDMARFMIAHLEGGSYREDGRSEVRILEESTTGRMQSTLYTPDPRLLGTAYGFFDLSEHDQHAIGHSGYAPTMHSILLLLPEQRLGVFVVYNTGSSGALTLQHSGFQQAFFDHFFPVSAAAPVRQPVAFPTGIERFAGTYRLISAPHTSLIKIVELFGAYRALLRPSDDGSLTLEVEGLERRFVQVEPLYFREADGPFAMIFREDRSGRVTQMHSDLMPQYTLVRLRWFDGAGFHLGLALTCVVLFLSMLVVAAVGLVRQRTPEGRRARATLVAISGLNLAFIAGVALWGNPVSELHSISFVARVVLGLGVVSSLLTLGALAYSALAWRNRTWGLGARAHYTAVTLAAVAFVWSLNYWNLLGWRY